MFWSARAANAISGTMISPDFNALPENLPMRNPSAFLRVALSGNVMTTIRNSLEIDSGVILSHSTLKHNTARTGELEFNLDRP
jgi:hypothetical protein